MYIKKIAKEIYTIKDMLRLAISQFSKNKIFCGHGTDNYIDEAIMLVMNSLFLPMNIPDIMLDSNLTLNERYHVIKLIMHRVKKRVPVAYLINKAWFGGLEFYVNENVMIPRSPIGELIGNRFREVSVNDPKHILDMCTGSGCIAISCANIYPKAKIDAVDISSRALSVARKNINLHKFKNRIKLIRSDLFAQLPYNNYDLIISNPPYVSDKEMKNLPLEFKAEPVISLSSGKDPLKFIKIILMKSLKYLSIKGLLICEIGNNISNLIHEYPNIPFTWLKLEKGGKGIFAINREKLSKHINLIKTN